MKIAAGQAERFSQKDQPAYHAVLFYGPDEGRVRERAKALARSVTGGVDDPFQSSVLGAAQLEESPSLLADEALQLSLMGGRRAVTLEGATDTHVAQIKTLLTESLPLPALVILMAGELTPRSKLRVLFDKEKTLACVATYVDDQRSLSDTIRDWARETNDGTGRQISREAEALLVQSLGGDRALTRQELEKLDLYMANDATARIEVADVQACLAGLTTIDQDDAIFAALAGDANNALRHLGNALDQGRAPEALVATYLYHLTRLSDGHAALSQGMNAREAVEKMRPPVFFQKKGAVANQLQKLSRGRTLQDFYLGALELQKNVRTQRDQGALYLERFLLSVASRSR